MMTKTDDQDWVCAANDPRISLSRRRADVLDPAHAPVAKELLTSYSAAEIQELALTLPPDYKAANAVWPMFHSSHDLVRLERFITYGGENPHIGCVAAYVAAAAQYSVSKSLLEIEQRQRRTWDALEQINRRVQTARDRKASALVAAFLWGRVEKDGGGDPPGAL